MYGILNRRWEQSGNDEQERLMLSFDKMFARERDTALGDLFSYWQAKRTDRGGIPATNDFSSRDKLPPTARQYTSWLDTNTPDPFNFVCRSHTKLTAFGDQSDIRLRDLTSKMNAKACATEYLFCKSRQQPMYHEIEQTVGSNSRHYVRLLLPMLDDNGEVTTLIYAVRLIRST